MFLLPLIGCLNTASDAAIYSALDYRIDRPRVLGIRVEPPLLSPGMPVALAALMVAPDQGLAVGATWSTCGLANTSPTSVQTLECFAANDDVAALVSGALPTPYTPPARLPGRCDGLDTGLSIRACAHNLPILVESDFASGEDPLLGAVQASWYLEPWPADLDVPRSANELVRALQIEGTPGPGEELLITYTIDADVREAAFRWFVDDGELLDTGETATHEWNPPQLPGEKGSTATSNRWVLPEEPGTYRLFVIFEGKAWSESSVYAGTPDQVWDSLEITI